MALMLLMSVFAGAVAAAAAGDVLNFGADVAEQKTAPNPYLIDDGFTKARHPMEEGSGPVALAGIYDDQGDWIGGAESIYVFNDTWDEESGENANPITYKPGHVEDSSLMALEDEGDETTVANASAWTKGGTNSSALTVSNATPNDGVEGVRFDTDGTLASGADAHANFTVAVDTDESKRVAQISLDMDSWDSTTNVTFRFLDETGDYKEVTLNQSEAVSGNNMANSSGDSKVFQIKLNKLATTGGGSWDNIETVQVLIEDGDADLTISWLDLRKKARNVLGEKRATTDDNGNDDDSDGDYDETQTIYNATGAVSVYSLETLDPEYGDAVLNDVSYPVHIPASALMDEGDEGDWMATWESAEDYPGFDHVLNVTYRLEAISYIDASYGGSMELRMVQGWPEDRYITVELEEGAAGSDLSDIDGTSQLSSLGAAQDEPSEAITLDASASSGTEYLINYRLKLTDSERTNSVEASAATATPGGSGAVAVGGGGGGPINTVLSIGVGLVVALLVWFRKALPFIGG